jgi:hypothetical protein
VPGSSGKHFERERERDVGYEETGVLPFPFISVKFIHFAAEGYMCFFIFFCNEVKSMQGILNSPTRQDTFSLE